MTDEEAKHFIKVLCEYIDEREARELKEKENEQGRYDPIRGHAIKHCH